MLTMRRFTAALAMMAACALLPATAGAATCTTTVSSVSAAQSAVAAASPGAVVCLSDGTYGGIELNAAKASPGVTLQSANPGGATVNGIDLNDSDGITIAQFNLTQGSAAQGSGVVMRPGASRDVVSHNDLNITGGGFGVFLYGDGGSISDVTIDGNRTHGSNVGDAIRLHFFANVTVSNNEFRDVNETGSHNDVLQTVHGGSNLVFKGNYAHDDINGQGFFVKDGQVTGVQVLDNLFVREPGNGREISVQEASNLLVDHNTVLSDQTIATTGSIGGSCLMSNNVSSRSLELQGACSTSGNLTGVTATDSRFRDPAHDDYRMASGQGVDWAPADKVFGPDGSAPPPPPPDSTAPQTTITDQPADGTATDATVKFTADEPSTFACALDGGAYASCTSPKTYTGLAVGGHTIAVRATDTAGNTDPTPATVSWTISEPPPPPPTTCDAACVADYEARLAAAAQQIDTLTGQVTDLTQQLADTTTSLHNVQALADAYKARAEAAEAIVAKVRADVGP